MSAPRADVDKGSEPCTTYDCVLNADVLAQSAAYRPLKVFLIELALGWVGQKYGSPLDPRFRLPKMRYKGGAVEAQRIRLERRALVTELRDVPEEPSVPLLAAKRPGGAAAAAAAGAAAAAKPAPQRGQEQGRQQQGQRQQQQGAGAAAPAGAAAELRASVAYEGCPVTHVVVSAQLPPQAAAAAAEAAAEQQQRQQQQQQQQHQQQQQQAAAPPQLSVAGRELLLEAPGCRPLRLDLGFFVDARAAQAELAPGGALRVRLPQRPVAAVLEELRRAAPHALGSLQLASRSYLELEA
jgi:hypothetical protein